VTETSARSDLPEPDAQNPAAGTLFPAPAPQQPPGPWLVAIQVILVLLTLAAAVYCYFTGEVSTGVSLFGLSPLLLMSWDGIALCLIFSTIGSLGVGFDPGLPGLVLVLACMVFLAVRSRRKRMADLAQGLPPERRPVIWARIMGVLLLVVLIAMLVSAARHFSEILEGLGVVVVASCLKALFQRGPTGGEGSSHCGPRSRRRRWNSSESDADVDGPELFHDSGHHGSSDSFFDFGGSDSSDSHH
jgi:hypothetical protein